MALACILTLFALALDAPAQLKPGLYATLDTTEGKITLELFERYTPNSVRHFIQLVQRSLLSGTTFYRVLREEMIQAGKNCGAVIPDEHLPGLKFDRPGRVALASAGPDLNGCEFFITTGVVSRWDNSYSVFGQVVSGQDVVERINKAPKHGDKLDNPVLIKSVFVHRVVKPK